MTRTRVTGSEREGVVAAPLGREPFLLDFLLDPVPGDGRQPIDEEHPVEVVELVLDDLRLQSLRFEGDRLAFPAEPPDAQRPAALDPGEGPGPAPPSPSVRSDLLRSTSAKIPGKDRHPSSSFTTPPRSVTTGLTMARAPRLPSSMTKMRSDTPICGAASPMPT